MAGFGALERVLMGELWDAGEPLPVREVRDRVNARGGRQLAYNTVQTVLDRLARRGARPLRATGRSARREGAAAGAAGPVDGVGPAAVTRCPGAAPGSAAGLGAQAMVGAGRVRHGGRGQPDRR